VSAVSELKTFKFKYTVTIQPALCSTLFSDVSFDAIYDRGLLSEVLFPVVSKNKQYNKDTIQKTKAIKCKNIESLYTTFHWEMNHG